MASDDAGAILRFWECGWPDKAGMDVGMAWEWSGDKAKRRMRLNGLGLEFEAWRQG